MSPPIAKTSRRDLFKTTASLGATASAALLGACATAQLGSGSGVGGIGADGTASGGSGSPIFNVPAITVPIVGTSSTFPVRRIYCIGRNYRAHAIEMGSNPDREPPFFFQKPTDAIQYVAPNKVVNHAYPTLTKNYHYEVELVACLNKGSGGKKIDIEQALDLVYGYALGLDMTRRDLQRALGDEKKPWEIGKSFDQSAPIGPIHRVADMGPIDKAGIWLKVNGATKQSANLAQMIWSVAEQISRLSEAFELKAGDIIYSGTPENVGPVVRGDVIECHIDGLPNLSIKIV
jgi:fumarylpyruvate hydrolase